MASPASVPAQTQEFVASEIADQAAPAAVVENSKVETASLPVSMPHTFLSLAPTTSASYPAPRKIAVAAKALITQDGQVDVVSAIVSTPEIFGQDMSSASRSSSMSSEASADVSSSQRKRFLRLGPVHHGAHADELGDWSEEVIIG